MKLLYLLSAAACLSGCAAFDASVSLTAGNEKSGQVGFTYTLPRGYAK